MSSSNIVLSAKNVSKCFNMYDRPSDRLKDLIAPKLSWFPNLKDQKYHQEFWALKNVSFEVAAGECVGIIGQNGSGKSTLLQIIAGTMTPTAGEVNVKGQVTALLELGSGFNPDFTGRENVFLNGCLLGLSRKEVEDKFDWIASFADIGQHLDQPVKTYSSGMMLRLAFAVQASIDMQVLIVDEALAVGDARFQLKCFKRLEELKSNGTTILFVSHATELVRSFCNRGLLLNKGDVVYWGDAREAATKYYNILFPQEKISSEIELDKPTILKKPEDDFSLTEKSIKKAFRLEEKNENKQNKKEEKTLINSEFEGAMLSLGKNDLKMSWGLGGASIDNVKINGIIHPNLMLRKEKFSITLDISLNYQQIEEVIRKEACESNFFVGVRFENSRGITVFDVFHEVPSNEMSNLKYQKKSELIVYIEVLVPELAQGDYFLSFGTAIGEVNKVFPLFSSDNIVLLNLEPDNTIHGLMKPEYKTKRIK